MAFVLYEIWTEDQAGHQELFDTAGNLPEAKKVAKEAIINGHYCAIIFEEADDDVIEIDRLKKS